MYSWEKNISDRTEIEYQSQEEELEEVLANSNLQEHEKESLRTVTKNIITAEILMENNPLVTEKDIEYLENTKAKYKEVKDSL